MIKNIIFDLSEVIISGYHGTDKLIEKKYSIGAKQFYKRKAEKNELFLNLMRGNLKEEEYWNELMKGMNWNITVEDLKTTIRQNLNQPITGTMEIIKQLKGKYHLILLSDHVKEWMTYIEQNNQEICIFDTKIFSYEIGSVKSDKRTFRTVLDRTQIIADETLFIDDYNINIKRAEEVGINGIVFKNAEQLQKDLDLRLKHKSYSSFNEIDR